MSRVDVAAPRSAGTVGRHFRDGLEFIRISALGASVLVATLGAVSTSAVGAAGPILAVAVIGVLFHVFAYVLNDVIDLDLDRTEPRRAQMPLVTGAISPAQGLAVAIACIPLCAAVTWVAAPRDTVLPALGSLAIAVAGLAIYDLVGKRTPFPPLTDLVQGIGWAALLMAGAWTAGAPTPLTAVLAAYITVFIVMINGVHGSLRDLPNDQRHRIVTTATLLGSRVGPDGRRIVSRALLAYAWALQAVLLGLALVGLAVAPATLPSFVTAAVLAAASVLLLAAASRRSGARIEALPGVAGPDGDLLAAGMLHLLASLGIPLAIVAAHTPIAIVAGMAAAYVLPVFTLGWLGGAGRWVVDVTRAMVTGAASGARDLFILTRPANCLAAGVAVAVGAHLGGAASIVSEPVLRAAITAVLVVAAGNVVNDAADVAEDRVNYPDRAIAAGRIDRHTAMTFAALLVAGALFLASSFGVVVTIVVACLACAGFAYSLWLKRTPVLGNLVVAGLGAATILFGALTVGQPTPAVAIGAAFAFISVLGPEILWSMLDRDGDAAAGRRTFGTLVSLGSGLRVLRGPRGGSDRPGHRRATGRLGASRLHRARPDRDRHPERPRAGAAARCSSATGSAPCVPTHQDRLVHGLGSPRLPRLISQHGERSGGGDAPTIPVQPAGARLPASRSRAARTGRPR